jgi:hypothetical protein
VAKLSQLLESKRTSFRPTEENIEQGQIFVFSGSSQYTDYWNGINWRAPADGTAVIEIWGASGSGALMCCCGFGLPGNPGAYSKKTIEVRKCDYVRGSVGKACTNSAGLCFRGCSTATCISWSGKDRLGNTSGCMCAQGGRGGVSKCSTGTSGFCCFAPEFCATVFPGCASTGIVCNRCINGNGFEACAYGGDCNCAGGFSCTSFYLCAPECICTTVYHIATSPGIISRDGAVLTYATENSNEYANWSGQGWHQSMAAMSIAGRAPGPTIPWATCWGFSGGCGCYDEEGCHRANPVGLPGHPSMPCAGVRDHATSGGDGSLRIKFIAR